MHGTDEGRVKFTLEQAVSPRGGVEVHGASTLSLTSALDWGGWYQYKT
jgi:hypothetical protein